MKDGSLDARRRVLVLAIDAASAPLIEAWSADGTLANIGRLRAQGLSGPTKSVDGFFVGATWPSFFTGTTPARHGVYNLARLRPGSYDVVACSGSDLARRASLWDQLSAQGQRVVVLDVPLCAPSRELNGVQVIEWGCHDAVTGFQAHPAALAEEILERYGSHPIGTSCDASNRTAEMYRAFERNLLAGIRAKSAMTRALMAREDWDFFIQVFSESHCAGHQAWHLHDTRHPAHPSDSSAATGDLIRNVYVGIDEAIGAILDEAGANTTVMLLVLHSMSYWYGAQILLHDMLVRLGATQSRQVPLESQVKSLIHGGLARGWAQVPSALRRRLAPLRIKTQAALATQVPAHDIRSDPRSSRCFVVHNGFPVGGIRLNLRGREPTGVLSPGDEAEAFSNKLIADLRQVVDPLTKRALIRDIWKTASRIDGECLGELPDLIVEWSDDQPLGAAAIAGGAGATVRAYSSKIGHLEGVNQYCRSGEHRPDGVFFVRGPGIAPGRLDRVTSILDLAPTIARMLDCNLADCDGQIISELVAH